MPSALRSVQSNFQCRGLTQLEWPPSTFTVKNVLLNRRLIRAFESFFDGTTFPVMKSTFEKLYWSWISTNTFSTLELGNILLLFESFFWLPFQFKLFKQKFSILRPSYYFGGEALRGVSCSEMTGEPISFVQRRKPPLRRIFSERSKSFSRFRGSPHYSLWRTILWKNPVLWIATNIRHWSIQA